MPLAGATKNKSLTDKAVKLDKESPEIIERLAKTPAVKENSTGKGMPFLKRGIDGHAATSIPIRACGIAHRGNSNLPGCAERRAGTRGQAGGKARRNRFAGKPHLVTSDATPAFSVSDYVNERIMPSSPSATCCRITSPRLQRHQLSAL